MEKNASGKQIEKDRNINAFKARMKQIVPGLFFGNVEHHTNGLHDFAGNLLGCGLPVYNLLGHAATFGRLPTYRLLYQYRPLI